MENVEKPIVTFLVPDQLRGMAERLDEALCAMAGTPNCRPLGHRDIMLMMSTLANAADEIDDVNAMMVQLASAYGAAKRGYEKATRPASSKQSRASHLTLVTTSVLASEGDAA
jgi:hypothetical protein